MQLFYNPNIGPGDKEIIFDLDESKHISKVLRKKQGDVLHVANGKGYLFSVEIIGLGGNGCRARILEVQAEKPKTHKLHLAVAPTKTNARYEWFLEKATEIGVDEITPIICDRGERKKIKRERFERILQSAMKQALQFTLPKLNPATSFSDFVENHQNEQLFIAHCEKDKKRHLKEGLGPGKDITVMIGPEGDFSRKEIETALKKGYSPVSLGENRLRTETAAIVACLMVSLANG